MACTYIALSLVCVDLLYGISIAEEPTCWCTLGQRCNNSTRFHRSLAKVNVALGKESKISSLKRIVNERYDYPLLEACLANNGNVGTEYIPSSRNKNHPNCVQTDIADLSPSWQVDIGRSYTITSITIYTVNGIAGFLRNITITVDDELCYTFDSKITYSVRNDVRCRTPILGRIVRLFKPKYVGRKPDFFAEYVIAVCEVQVWVCKPDHYGEECDQRCEPTCKSGCDGYYGYCTDGCKIGYYGHFCSEKCSDNCLNGACQHFGICTHGCEANWQGKRCDEARAASVAEDDIEKQLPSIYIVIAVSGIFCTAILVHQLIVCCFGIPLFSYVHIISESLLTNGMTVCIRKRLVDNASDNLGSSNEEDDSSILNMRFLKAIGYNETPQNSKADVDEVDDTGPRNMRLEKTVEINETPQNPKAEPSNEERDVDNEDSSFFHSSHSDEDEDENDDFPTYLKGMSSSRKNQVIKSFVINETPQDSKAPSVKPFPDRVRADVVEVDDTGPQKKTSSSRNMRLEKTVEINETPQNPKAASGIGGQGVGSSSEGEQKK